MAIALHGLDADQAEAVRRLTLHGEAITCLIGPAGAGKSRAMGAAAEAWSDSGWPRRHRPPSSPECGASMLSGNGRPACACATETRQ